MPIGDIDELATFVHIVDHQGVSAAARALGRPKSSVSRKLAMLEDRLGARLLDRGVGGQRLTETGHTVYAHARRILQELDQIDNAARPDDPQGLLRISSTFALVDTVLRPILPKFLSRYEKIDVEIEAISRRNDLLRDDFDVAVRAGLLSGGALIARRLAEVSVGLFASPSYLARHDAPTARTLASHAMVGLVGQSLATTDYGSGPLRRQRLSTNDPLLIKGFVLDGFALGWLPLYLCRAEIAEGRLIRCLPERTISGPEVFALFHGRPEAPVKVRAFVDFLVTELALR